MNLDKVKPEASAEAMRERVRQSGTGAIADALAEALSNIEKAAAAGLTTCWLYVKAGISSYVRDELHRRGFIASSAPHSDAVTRVEVSW